MALRINSNPNSMFAAQRLGRTTKGLNRSLNRLSSGLRINSAADDAAGLAIAERFQTRVRQYTQETNSLQTGVNAVRTAEGGLEQQQAAVSRIRELAVQAANGTLSDANRQALNQEAQQLLEEIDATAENTQFNEMGLLNGEAQNVDLGTEGDATLNVDESTTATMGIAGVDLSTAEGATEAIEALDAAADQISQGRASLGAQENRFESAIEQRQVGIVNTTAAESAIRDADIAREVMNRTRNEILLQSGIAALVQANVVPQSALSLLGG